MRRLLAMAALVAALVAAPAAAATPQATASDWRLIARAADRERLRGWRDSWMAALAQARAAGNGAAIDAEGPLLAPDRSLTRPLPPAGAYRCRTIKLGTQRSPRPAFVSYPAVPCRVAVLDEVTVFSEIAGPQRHVARLYPDTDGRAVLLGSLLLADEQRPFAYGRDAIRDVAGYVERIGAARWRIVLPRPRFESVVDVIELVPVS